MKTGKLVHGAIDSDEARKYKNLQKILGHNKRENKSKDQYLEELNSMTMGDLKSHAYKNGIYPVEQRERLIDNLLKDFLKRNSAFQGTVSRQTKTAGQIAREDKDARQKEAQEALRGG